MKKLTALAFALVCVLGLAGCNAKTKSMNYIIENKPSVTGIVREVHNDYVIMYSDTADGYPNGSEWQISLNVENKDSYTDLDVGDEIVVYHDGNVMETDPLKVGTVYAITLKTIADRTQSESNPSDVIPGGTSSNEVFDITVSYANWAHAPMESFGALNTDKLAISSVRHLPIYKFDTLKDLEQFKLFDDKFTLGSGYNEVPSFNDAVAKYDDTFFEENSLMLVYVAANSGTYRFGVNSVFCDGNSFSIHVEQTNNPEAVTADMAGWFITIAVPDSMIENCTEFDADLNNDFNQSY